MLPRSQLRRGSPSGNSRLLTTALVVPAILTLGVVAYAALVVTPYTGSLPPGAASPPPAAPAIAERERLRGSVPLQEPVGQVSKVAPRLLADALPLVSSNPPEPQSTGSAAGALDGLGAKQGHVLSHPSDEKPVRDLEGADDARAVQRRLADLGYFSGMISGGWGPLSRASLRSFKEANGLAADAVWDAPTEKALFRNDASRAEPFVGRWAADVQACSPRATKGGHLPTIIDAHEARAGESSCLFTDKRRTGNSWRMAAQCKSGKERWTSQIELVIVADRLSWSSERGRQEYVRCRPPAETASRGRKISAADIALR